MHDEYISIRTGLRETSTQRTHTHDNRAKKGDGRKKNAETLNKSQSDSHHCHCYRTNIPSFPSHSIHSYITYMLTVCKHRFVCNFNFSIHHSAQNFVIIQQHASLCEPAKAHMWTVDMTFGIRFKWLAIGTGDFHSIYSKDGMH